MQQRQESNNEHGRLLRYTCMSMLVVVLVAGHGIVLAYVSSHLALSATAVAGLIALILAKHIGLFGPAYVWLRRHFRRDQR